MEKKLKKTMESELKELNTKLDEKKLYLSQKTIIEHIFGVYFYLLKLEVPSKLLPCALKGLSKYCHVVNVELVSDLVCCVSEKSIYLLKVNYILLKQRLNL